MDNGHENRRAAAPAPHYMGRSWASDERIVGAAGSPHSSERSIDDARPDDDAKIFGKHSKNIVVTHDFSVKSEYVKGNEV